MPPGATVLVQGATGGVATALTVLGSAAGIRVWVTGRSEEKRARALELGADQAFEPGARLPERVDAVMETTGQATWAHSIRALKPGGTIVISGATTGDAPPAELTRIFFLQLSVIGSTMGTREELERLIRLCVDKGVRPVIHSDAAADRRPRGLRDDAARRDRRARSCSRTQFISAALSPISENSSWTTRSGPVIMRAPSSLERAPLRPAFLIPPAPGRDSFKGSRRQSRVTIGSSSRSPWLSIA